MLSFREIVLISLIIGIIGVPLSYVAMLIERKEVNLSCISWIRIYMTFVITGVISIYVYTKVKNKVN